MTTTRSGLWAQDQAIPLQGVEITSTLTGLCEQTTVAQRYRNAESQPVEAVYVFPLPEGAAVSGFEIHIGDRHLEGLIEEREAAFERYDDALAEGHGAFLLDQERPDVFTASVGNLEPGAEVTIRISYAARLTLEGDAIRLKIPTTVSPRFAPPSDDIEIGQPDAERVNPPTRASVPYGLHLTVEIEGEGGVRSLESPSHTVRAILGEDRAEITLTSEAALDRDFILLTRLAEPHRPRAHVARDDAGRRLALVTFIPDREDLSEHPQEVVFVLDCSGSMQGESIEQARRALAVCLRVLQDGDRFNIVRFGSSHNQLFQHAEPYSQETLDQATRFVEDTRADLGGTRILQPLAHVFQQRLEEGTATRQVIVLTDGQVSNEDAVIQLCEQHRQQNRVFSFGIGAGVGEHLVKGIARASRGASEFIYPGERIEPKVIRTVSRARTPSFQKVSVDWGALQVEQAPATCPPVFAGEALSVLARIRGGDADTITLIADDHRWSVPIDLERAPSGGPIPALWARAAIRDLEEGKGLKRSGSRQRRGSKRTPEERARDAIITLSREYRIASSFTSFVAVETRAEGEKTTRPVVLREVPQALTAGWGGSGGGVLTGAVSTSSYSKFDSMEMERSAPASPPVMGGAPRKEKKKRRKKRSRGLFRGKGRAKKSNDAFAPQGRIRPTPAPIAPEGFASQRLASAAPGAAPSGSSDVLDRVYALLMRQNADGSFPLDAVTGWLDADLTAAARRAATQHDARVVATILALHVLGEQASAHRDQWSSAAGKALSWLDRQGTDLTLDDIRRS